MTQESKPWHVRVAEWGRNVKGVLEAAAKALICAFMLGSMFIVGRAADPAAAKAHVPFADRILSWSFVVFSVGLAELFVLFVIMTVLGKIDLARAFYDKNDDPAVGSADSPTVERAVAEGFAAQPAKKSPSVSLARLQAFLWTLVVMTVYFHRVVKDHGNGLPTIPPELLMVMGISGAVYLTSKGMEKSAQPKTKVEG